MSKPTIGCEFWMKTPTVKFDPTATGPNIGGLTGQLVTVEGETTQTRPVFGGVVTWTKILTECERLPLIPVTVTVKAMLPTPGLAVTVIFDLVDPFEATTSGLGLYTTEIPDGSTLLDSVTVPLKLLKLVAVRTSVEDPPCLTDNDVEAADSVKSGEPVPLVVTVAP